MESAEVAAMLPAWLDLMFGTAQRGPGAFRLFNTFPPPCYPGVELEATASEEQVCAGKRVPSVEWLPAQGTDHGMRYFS